eukprot:jgi/Mesvir1/20142/Mv13381-RA.1
MRIQGDLHADNDITVEGSLLLPSYDVSYYQNTAAQDELISKEYAQLQAAQGGRWGPAGVTGTLALADVTQGQTLGYSAAKWSNLDVAVSPAFTYSPPALSVNVPDSALDTWVTLASFAAESNTWLQKVRYSLTDLPKGASDGEAALRVEFRVKGLAVDTQPGAGEIYRSLTTDTTLGAVGAYVGGRWVVSGAFDLEDTPTGRVDIAQGTVVQLQAKPSLELQGAPSATTTTIKVSPVISATPPGTTNLGVVGRVYASAQPGATAANVYTGTTGGAPVLSVFGPLVDGSAALLTFDGLTPATTYHLYLAAKNSAGLYSQLLYYQVPTAEESKTPDTGVPPEATQIDITGATSTVGVPLNINLDGEFTLVVNFKLPTGSFDADPTHDPNLQEYVYFYVGDNTSSDNNTSIAMGTRNGAVWFKIADTETATVADDQLIQSLLHMEPGAETSVSITRTLDANGNAIYRWTINSVAVAGNETYGSPSQPLFSYNPGYTGAYHIFGTVTPEYPNGTPLNTPLGGEVPVFETVFETSGSLTTNSGGALPDVTITGGKLQGPADKPDPAPLGNEQGVWTFADGAANTGSVGAGTLVTHGTFTVTNDQLQANTSSTNADYASIDLSNAGFNGGLNTFTVSVDYQHPSTAPVDANDASSVFFYGDPNGSYIGLYHDLNGVLHIKTSTGDVTTTANVRDGTEHNIVLSRLTVADGGVVTTTTTTTGPVWLGDWGFNNVLTNGGSGTSGSFTATGATLLAQALSLPANTNTTATNLVNVKALDLNTTRTTTDDGYGAFMTEIPAGRGITANDYNLTTPFSSLNAATSTGNPNNGQYHVYRLARKAYNGISTTNASDLFQFWYDGVEIPLTTPTWTYNTNSMIANSQIKAANAYLRLGRIARFSQSQSISVDYIKFKNDIAVPTSTTTTTSSYNGMYKLYVDGQAIAIPAAPPELGNVSIATKTLTMGAYNYPSRDSTWDNIRFLNRPVTALEIQKLSDAAPVFPQYYRMSDAAFPDANETFAISVDYTPPMDTPPSGQKMAGVIFNYGGQSAETQVQPYIRLRHDSLYRVTLEVFDGTTTASFLYPSSFDYGPHNFILERAHDAGEWRLFVDGTEWLSSGATGSRVSFSTVHDASMPSPPTLALGWVVSADSVQNAVWDNARVFNSLLSNSVINELGDRVYVQPDGPMKPWLYPGGDPPGAASEIEQAVVVSTAITFPTAAEPSVIEGINLPTFFGDAQPEKGGFPSGNGADTLASDSLALVGGGTVLVSAANNNVGSVHKTGVTHAGGFRELVEVDVGTNLGKALFAYLDNANTSNSVYSLLLNSTNSGGVDVRNGYYTSSGGFQTATVTSLNDTGGRLTSMSRLWLASTRDIFGHWRAYVSAGAKKPDRLSEMTPVSWAVPAEVGQIHTVRLAFALNDADSGYGRDSARNWGHVNGSYKWDKAGDHAYKNTQESANSAAAEGVNVSYSADLLTANKLATGTGAEVFWRDFLPIGKWYFEFDVKSQGAKVTLGVQRFEASAVPVQPVAPLAKYTFDSNNCADSSGNGLHGTLLSGSITSTTKKFGAYSYSNSATGGINIDHPAIKTALGGTSRSPAGSGPPAQGLRIS